MVVFDAAALTLLLWNRAKPPVDPGTGQPVANCRQRMELLVQTLHKARETILVPTPVLSEVLVVTGHEGLSYVQILQRASVFQIQPFDTLAAIELAEMNRVAIDEGDKKSGEDAPWQQIKIDRQIVSIAKVARASTIYSNDERLGRFAAKAGIQTIGVHELPLPPEPAQFDMIKALEEQAASERGEDEPTDEEIEADEPEHEADDIERPDGD